MTGRPAAPRSAAAHRSAIAVRRSAAGAGPVVVVGDVMTDVLARLPTAIATGGDTAAAVRLGPGGSAANVAAWAAAAGLAVSMVGRVGDDVAGRLAAAELVAAGVTPRLAVDPRRPTGVCLVLLDAAGERSMLPDRGANLALAPADLPAELFARGGHLHLSGYALAHPGPRPAALAALERARRSAMTVSVGSATAAALGQLGRAPFLAALVGVDLLIVNEAEAALLAEGGQPELLAGGAGPRAVVVTRGRRGASWFGSDGRTDLPAAAVAEVVDTVGAGDAFAAGLLAGWLAGEGAAAALRAALDAAAHSVTRAGGWPPR